MSTTSAVPARRDDPLWVPLLTHFRAVKGTVSVDRQRVIAHVASIKANVRQFLLAGSTGDGWDLDAAQFADLLELSRDPVFAGTRVLLGVLRPTTEEVIARARMVEDALAAGEGPAGAYVGLTVCPPVEAGASQDAILAHYRAILDATKSAIAVYELPQITRCSIAPATMRALAEDARIIMFKDTSGKDVVAAAGPYPGVTMVRGAEGGYLEALPPHGRYDGWLLSSANVFGQTLRRILDLRDAHELFRARALSGLLSSAVQTLFEAAADVGFGNAFSNANRAADHLLATGSGWRAAPLPIGVNGETLPLSLLETAADLLNALPAVHEEGYVGARAARPRVAALRRTGTPKRRARR